MQSREFEIAILGGGCIGSSILYALCLRDKKNVVLVDNGRRNISATANSGGMLRVFHENLAHIHLALNNFTLLDTYQQSKVFTERANVNGNLYFFDKKRYRNYKNNFSLMERLHYPFEILTPLSGKERFPQYTWNSQWAVYEPKGNQLSPKIFMDDLLVASQKLGANILDDFEVNNICYKNNKYTLQGVKKSITSKILILAGGARLLPKLNHFGIKLNIEVKNITTYLAKKTHPLQWPNYFDRESLQFGCFSHNDNVLLSEKNNAPVNEKKWGKIMIKKSASDLYANNRMGILGKIPGTHHLFIATGWGGTAFKFALEIGQRIANAIEINSPRTII